MRAEAQAYFSGLAFKLAAWPQRANDIAESTHLQLALCETEEIARRVCRYADETDPAAPLPRRFRNAIVAVAPSLGALDRAIDHAQRLLATEAIERETPKGDEGKLVREQIQRVRPQYLRQFRLQTCRAFDRVVVQEGKAMSLEEQYQFDETEIMRGAQGQKSLRKFLDDKKLIYQPGDALDIGKFLKDVLPGATPLAEDPDVFTAKAIHERFLAAPGLRLVPDHDVIRATILNGVKQGMLAVRLADGRAYDAKGCVAGPQGARRRTSDTLTTLALNDTTLVTRADSAAAVDWTTEDPVASEVSGVSGTTSNIPVPPPSVATATSWEKVAEYAAQRPLRELHLTASTPAAAKNLVSLAQPLGADSLSLSVTLSGALKDGGQLNLAISEVKVGNPIKPLATAETLFNALTGGASFEADLKLGFGPDGRTGMADLLARVAQEAEGIALQATFGKPGGGEA